MKKLLLALSIIILTTGAAHAKADVLRCEEYRGQFNELSKEIVRIGVFMSRSKTYERATYASQFLMANITKQDILSRIMVSEECHFGGTRIRITKYPK